MRWIVATALLAGCSALLGIDVPDITRPDAAPGWADAAPGAADASGPDAPGPDASPCDIVYVAPTGNDAMTGCNPAAPVATLYAAVTSIVASGGSRILFCAGTYDTGGFAVAPPLSIEGSYDCTTWTRTANYGYPSFDGLNKTVLKRTGSGAVLTLSGSATIDGFVLQGGPVNPQVVSVGSGFSTMTNDQINGGSESSTFTYGSIGVEVTGGGAPTIQHCTIDGGSGQAMANNTAGSAGIVVHGGNLSVSVIQNNTISGGSGTTTSQNAIGSAGIIVTGGTMEDYFGKGISGNTIHGGSGSCSGGSFTTWPSVGVLLGMTSNNEVDLTDNRIEGDSGTGCQSGPVGVLLQGTPYSYLLRNRIVGSTSAANSAGIWVAGTLGVHIHNNMIMDIGGAGIVVAAKSVVIEFDTIEATVGVQIQAQTANAGAVLISNIIFGTGGAADVGVSLPVASSCPSTGAMNYLENNAFWGQAYLMTQAAACGATTFTTTASMESEITAAYPPATASGNQLVATTSTSVFASWSSGDKGYTTLMGGGWIPQTNAPCAITQGALSTGVNDDFFKNTRTAPISTGAVEFDGTCL